MSSFKSHVDNLNFNQTTGGKVVIFTKKKKKKIIVLVLYIACIFVSNASVKNGEWI